MRGVTGEIEFENAGTNILAALRSYVSELRKNGEWEKYITIGKK